MNQCSLACSLTDLIILSRCLASLYLAIPIMATNALNGVWSLQSAYSFPATWRTDIFKILNTSLHFHTSKFQKINDSGRTHPISRNENKIADFLKTNVKDKISQVDIIYFSTKRLQLRPVRMREKLVHVHIILYAFSTSFSKHSDTNCLVANKHIST